MQNLLNPLRSIFIKEESGSKLIELPNSENMLYTLYRYDESTINLTNIN